MSKRGWSIEGKTVFITGGGRGIGLGVGRRLAERGANVALVDLEADVLEEAAVRCPGAATFVADVTDNESLAAAVDGAIDRFGGIDVCFANAGISPVGMVRSIDPAAWERTVEIDLLGVWRTVRACLPAVIERQGYILPVASVAALAHLPGMSPYCVSKAGVDAFANCLRTEVNHLGVTVGCAYYSWIDTALVRGADAHQGGGTMRSSIKGPFGKTYPLEMAIDATVRGMEKRSRHVVAPSWVRGMMLMRGFLPPFIDFESKRLAPKFDRMLEEDIAARGVAEVSRPVGPGGAAAVAAAIKRAAPGKRKAAGAKRGAGGAGGAGGASAGSGAGAAKNGADPKVGRKASGKAGAKASGKASAAASGASEASAASAASSENGASPKPGAKRAPKTKRTKSGSS